MSNICKNMGIHIIKLTGVNVLWASLNDFVLLAMAIHSPDIKKEYVSKIIKVKMIVKEFMLNASPFSISKLSLTRLSDIIIRIILIIRVMMELIVIAKNFPSINSLLFIG